MGPITGLEKFDRGVHKSNEWLNSLDRRLGTDRRDAYRILRAYFHVLRDRLTVDEAAHLAAQLPHLLRGVFYEGWDPSRTPVLREHVTPGEMEDVLRMLPTGVRRVLEPAGRS